MGLQHTLKSTGRSNPPGDPEPAEKRTVVCGRNFRPLSGYCSFHIQTPLGAEGGGSDPGYPGRKVYLL